MDMKLCVVDDCDRQHKARGWCSMHYLQNERAGTLDKGVKKEVITTCQFEDCLDDHVARGWCKRHYEQWKRDGQVRPVRGAAADPHFWEKVDATMKERFAANRKAISTNDARRVRPIEGFHGEGVT